MVAELFDGAVLQQLLPRIGRLCWQSKRQAAPVISVSGVRFSLVSTRGISPRIVCSMMCGMPRSLILPSAMMEDNSLHARRGNLLEIAIRSSSPSLHETEIISSRRRHRRRCRRCCDRWLRFLLVVVGGGRCSMGERLHVHGVPIPT